MLDRRHKLDPQYEIAFKEGSSSIYWTAAQVKDYALLCLDLLRSYIDTTDPKWLCWTKHCVMLKHMYKERFKMPSDIFALHYAALDHYSTFTQVTCEDYLL